MTFTRYQLARFLKLFHYHPKQRRMTESTQELHLLKDLEAYLGEQIWQQVENIEVLSLDYWNIRKLTNQKKLIQEHVANIEHQLEQAALQSSQVGSSDTPTRTDEMQEIQKKREQLAELYSQKEACVAEQEQARRDFAGLKTKLDVLESEHASPDRVTQCQEDIVMMRKQFDIAKKEIVKINEIIESLSDQIQQGQSKLPTKQEVFKHVSYEITADLRQELLNQKAMSNSLDQQMHAYYMSIGAYMRKNTHLTTVNEMVKEERSIVKILHALNDSIVWNQNLVGNKK